MEVHFTFPQRAGGVDQGWPTRYEIKLTSVRITEVVIIVEVDGALGGGGGATAPGELICPSNAEQQALR